DAPIGALAHDRLILRDQSAQATIGGGEVVDPFASTRHRRRPERIQRLTALANPAEEAARQLTARDPGYIERFPFAVAYNLRPEEAGAIWDKLEAVVSGLFVFSQERWIAARQNLIATLAAHHEKSPYHPGLQTERLRNLMDIQLSKQAFAEVLSAER